jgi:hypothetical protein
MVGLLLGWDPKRTKLVIPYDYTPDDLLLPRDSIGSALCLYSSERGPLELGQSDIAQPLPLRFVVDGAQGAALERVRVALRHELHKSARDQEAQGPGMRKGGRGSKGTCIVVL